MSAMDAIDHHLLVELQANGRLTNNELADRVGLSPSACLRRVRRLEEDGVIVGWAALVDPATVDRELDVFVEITLDSQSDDHLDAFEAAVVHCPQVMSCHLMAGEFDYRLHLAVADAADYEHIHRNHLSSLPGVARIRSSFAMRTVFATTRYDLPTPTPTPRRTGRAR